MKVDLSKLKAGDKVRLRCGVDLTVEKTEPMGLEAGAVRVYFADDFAEEAYHKDGRGWVQAPNGLLNIIEILPAPFDWKDAKPGMGFFHTNTKQNWIFIGNNPIHRNCVVCMNLSGNDAAAMLDKKYLIPAPEHDIEVAE